MAKSFIKGVTWGGVISIAALGAATVLVGPPEPSDAPQEVLSATASRPAGIDQAAATGSTETRSPVSPAPAPDTLSALPDEATAPAAVPQVGAAETMVEASETPAAPAITAGSGTPKTPGATLPPSQSLVTPPGETEISVSTEPAQPRAPQAVTEVAQVSDPAQPETPDAQTQSAPYATATPESAPAVAEPSISTDPAQPPLPEVAAPATAFAETVTAQADALPEAQGDDAATETVGETEAVAEAELVLSDAPIAAQIEAPAAPAPAANPNMQQPALPAARGLEEPLDLALVTQRDVLRPAPSETALSPAASDNPAPPAPPVAAAPEEPEQQETAVPPAPQAAAPVAEPQAEVAPAPAPDTQAEIAPEPEAAPDAEPAPQAAAERPSTFEADGGAIPGRPAGTLGNLSQNVTINRLPSLADPAAAPAEEGAVPQLADILPEGGTPPIARFAEAVDNPDGKPLMAVVLMDEGADLEAQTVGLPALRSFPYPVSFAVNALLPDATERMRAYRAEGFEVLAMVDLPEGASARDAETTMEVALAAVPEAVGVLEGVGSGIQNARAAADQVTEILAQTGHGFVTQNKGLNTTQKLAAQSGVPSAVVFRDFDSAGQTPTVMRRFLDQAAFRAGQEGGVIMLGRLREDTISALLVWGLQSRASQVALVPVSGLLKTQE